MKTKEDIFQYQNLQHFLEDLAQAKGLTREQFSQILGYQTRGAASLIMGGKRALSTQAEQNLVEYLRLSGRSERYLRTLSEKSRTKSRSEIASHDQSLKVLRHQHRRFLNRQKLGSLGKKWLYTAVREVHHLATTAPINPRWIKDQLLFPASLQEITEALRVVRSSESFETGEYNLRPNHKDAWIGDNDQTTENLIRRESHRKTLELAVSALDQVSLEERKFSNLTLSIKEKDISAIKSEIMDFVHWLDQKYSQRAGDRVFTVQLAAFPLTRGSDINADPEPKVNFSKNKETNHNKSERNEK